MKFLRCLFGLHQLEIYKEEDLKDTRGDIVGKVIISRCVNCGKLKQIRIFTIKEIY